jgi:hypothetical protein
LIIELEISPWHQGHAEWIRFEGAEGAEEIQTLRVPIYRVAKLDRSLGCELRKNNFEES